MANQAGAKFKEKPAARRRRKQQAAARCKPQAQARRSGADGKAVYDKVCFACHAESVAGSPKLGDKAAWAPRIKRASMRWCSR